MVSGGAGALPPPVHPHPRGTPNRTPRLPPGRPHCAAGEALTRAAGGAPFNQDAWGPSAHIIANARPPERAERSMVSRSAYRQRAAPSESEVESASETSIAPSASQCDTRVDEPGVVRAFSEPAVFDLPPVPA